VVHPFSTTHTLQRALHPYSVFKQQPWLPRQSKYQRGQETHDADHIRLCEQRELCACEPIFLAGEFGSQISGRLLPHLFIMYVHSYRILLDGQRRRTSGCTVRYTGRKLVPQTILRQSLAKQVRNDWIIRC
jgi:hypothetical protein